MGPLYSHIHFLSDPSMIYSADTSVYYAVSLLLKLSPNLSLGLLVIHNRRWLTELKSVRSQLRSDEDFSSSWKGKIEQKDFPWSNECFANLPPTPILREQLQTPGKMAFLSDVGCSLHEQASQFLSNGCYGCFF